MTERTIETLTAHLTRARAPQIAKHLERELPATGSQYNVPDGTVGGLVLRVNADGSMSWSLRYRIGKVQRRIKLGTFPAMRERGRMGR